MIHSMTGFGAAVFEVDGVAFDVEARSVNHRYLDVRVRLPRHLNALESDARVRVTHRLGRGKVDVTVSPAGGSASLSQLEIDHDVARRYVEAGRSLSAEFAPQVAGNFDIAALLALPGVTRLVETELSHETFAEALAGALDEAISALVAMRAAEGAALASDFESRLQGLLEIVAEIDQRSEQVQQGSRDRLRKRTEQLRDETGLLDEARLHQEIVLAADRMDITEELVRLRSHVDQFRAILRGNTGVAGSSTPAGNCSGPVGRSLDFLIQEMGREANTVGSKAGDALLAHGVVELKTELERIREQVQNVE